MQRTKQWALVAAAQSGAWWRCEFDLGSVRLLCKNSQDYEKELEIAKAEKAKAERVEAQQALRSGPAQQQAEKHQQQQQFLRRLLMPDATLCDDEVDAEATAASRGTSAKCVIIRKVAFLYLLFWCSAALHRFKVESSSTTLCAL